MMLCLSSKSFFLEHLFLTGSTKLLRNQVFYYKSRLPFLYLPIVTISINLNQVLLFTYWIKYKYAYLLFTEKLKIGTELTLIYNAYKENFVT